MSEDSIRRNFYQDYEDRRRKRIDKEINKIKSQRVTTPASVTVAAAAVPSTPLPGDHGALSGLDDDDHAQYLLRADNTVKTGWEIGLDETDVTIAMNDGTRTFTITPIAEMSYFILGIKYSISIADTVVIDDTEGLWYIYFVGTTLTASQSRWEIADGDKAMICILYWDATNNATIVIGWQFHSHFMAAGTHDYAHHSFGTRYASGLAVTDAGADLLNVAAGVIFDEDIEIDITDGAGSDLFEQVLSPAELPLLYRDGVNGDWRKIAATTTPVILTANVLQLNELNGVWALSNVTNNSYIAYWILATDDISEPIISIPGQVEGTNIVNVRENNPISSMDFGGLPVAEFRVIARLIVRGLVGGIFYEVSAIDDFRAVSSEPGTTQPNIHASSHFPNGVDELLLDEDDMASDLATKGSSQQAIKAYADLRLLISEIDDTPVDGVTVAPISSNWAFDHAASPADINHLTDAQIAALHAAVVAGDLNHNDLANIDADDINHLTDIQVAALHAVVVAGDLNHNDLANIDADDINHLTDVQVAALHAEVTDLDHDALTNFEANEHVALPNTSANVINDMLDEDDLVTDSNTQPATQQSIKAYVDASVVVSGDLWMPHGIFTASITAGGLVTSGAVRAEPINAGNSFMIAGVPLDWRKVINGVTVYLQINTVTVYWNQVGGGDDIDRMRLIKMDASTLGTAAIDDATNRGSAGENSQVYTSSGNDQLDATWHWFLIILQYITSGAGADFKLVGMNINYEYS